MVEYASRPLCFTAVVGCLVRRFPIHWATDSHAEATGGEPQICYKFDAGEAPRTLRPTSVLSS
jgi:hypothetical protein